MLREISAHRIPVLLLCAWLGYSLYPFVPVIDLHKYWDALKPVVLHPNLGHYDFLRHTAIWLGIAAAIAGVVGRKHAAHACLAFGAFVFFAKVLIVNATLDASEVAGAVTAFFLWLALSTAPRRQRSATIAAALGLCVVAMRIEPFVFGPASRHFGWIPFISFMKGSTDLNVRSFLEKFFLYGCIIWLLTQAGLRLLLSTLLVAFVLMATSYVEIFLPGRSAEITDAVLALLIGGIFALTDSARNRPSGATALERAVAARDSGNDRRRELRTRR